MIVKKKPILQGFPEFARVKYLTGLIENIDGNPPVFYDIETTGLSPKTSFVYLIGAISYEESTWVLHQWMCEAAREEKNILQLFQEFLSSHSCLVQYNGSHFDQPYLEARCEKYQLPALFSQKTSLDLYLRLKPLKNLLKLAQMKQPCLESFLGFDHRIYCDGKNCIRIYHNYEKTRQGDLADEVLGHNEEDLRGLGKITSLLAYFLIFKGDYLIEDVTFFNEEAVFILSLPVPLPVEFSNKSDEFYLTGKDSRIKLSAKARNGRLKQHYLDFKNYDYIPSEDSVLPKSISQYMERGLRKPAKLENCYTWFSCTEAFLQNPIQIKDYLDHTFAYLLKALK